MAPATKTTRSAYLPVHQNLRRLVEASIGLGGPMRKLELLGLVAAIQLGAADPRIGSWRLISAQSALDPPNKISITSLQPGVHVVTSGDTHVDFTAKFDGHEAPVQGNPAFNQI